MAGSVDIETEWNLKTDVTPKVNFMSPVDIETEWNLKPDA